jgi:hypothetical protein
MSSCNAYTHHWIPTGRRRMTNRGMEAEYINRDDLSAAAISVSRRWFLVCIGG